MRPSPRLRAPVSLAVILSGSLAAGLGLSGCTEQGSGAAASVSTPTSVGPLGSATPAATGTSAAPTPSGAESAEGAAAILGKVLADQPVAITASGAEGPFKRGDVYVGTAFHVAGKLDPAVCGDRLEFAFPPGIQPDLMAKQGHVASDGLADVSGTDDCKFAHGVYFVHAGVLDAPLAGRVRECVRAALFRAQSI